MISIIIPCYNHVDYLQRSVGSALRQTHPEIEIIVVDDGSATPVQNAWGGKVRVIRHERNRGLSTALNTGIAAATGDRFIILAADDELAPRAVELMAAVYRDVVSCDMHAGGKRVPSKPGDLTTLLTANCHSYAALVRKSLWAQVGGFKALMNPSWEDYEFWLNCAKHEAQWGHVSQALHIYHRNPTGRDVESQGKERLLRGKLEGYHPDLFGPGRGLVTFVIPCYDHERFLLEAVESVLSQLYPHTNVVVVDDGSPGDVKAALVGVSDPTRVKLVRQRNKHLSGARNTGIREALASYNSQYLVMLDADDTVHPEFVERLMSNMEPRQYVYSDIQFIGDAWHTYELGEYDCHKLALKHQHPCTFLMESAMVSELIARRGYAYDETMKQGYEDWECALACAQAGYCGRRVAIHLFNYRFHEGGSMRTYAQKHNKELVAQIYKRHPWAKNKETIDMACSSCANKARIVRVATNGGMMAAAVNVPGVGIVEATEPLEVTYTGSQGSTITKLGRGLPGQGTAIYRYSANPEGTYGPTFTIWAIDANLFNGPYKFRRLTPVQPQAEIVSKPQPVAVKPVEIAKEPPMADQTLAKFEAKLAKIDTTVYEPDDFTQIKGIGPAGDKRLKDAGIAYFEDMADAPDSELAQVLGVSESQAKRYKTQARKAIDAPSAE